MIVIKKLNNPAIAHIYKIKLEDNGVQTLIRQQSLGSVMPMLNQTYHISVQEKDLEKATEIIKIIDAESFEPKLKDKNFDIKSAVITTGFIFILFFLYLYLKTVLGR